MQGGARTSDVVAASALSVLECAATTTRTATSPSRVVSGAPARIAAARLAADERS
jgi:hypothetical protein